jgi:hypothetical protein
MPLRHFHADIFGFSCRFAAAEFFATIDTPLPLPLSRRCCHFATPLILLMPACRGERRYATPFR